MAKDKSYIQVPSITYVTVELNILKQFSSPIATGSAVASTSSTTEVAIDNAPEAPTEGGGIRFEFGSPITTTGSFDGSIPSSRTTSEFETF